MVGSSGDPAEILRMVHGGDPAEDGRVYFPLSIGLGLARTGSLRGSGLRLRIGRQRDDPLCVRRELSARRQGGLESESFIYAFKKEPSVLH